MANLQYIGARYVPKFYLNPDYPAPDTRNNEWKSGVDYEPLTIVTYNNDSYTSKKPVPDTIGNPADNVEYWACTTKYTAALMALQTTIQNLEDFVDPDTLDTESQIVSGAINEIVGNINKINTEFLESPRTVAADIILDGIFDGDEYINGTCYIGNNKVVAYFASNLSDTGILRCFDLENYSIVWEYPVLGYHGNSICYRKANNSIYIAGCFSVSDRATLIDKVIVVNLDTPSIYNEITAPIPMYSLAIDNDTDKFYAVRYRGTTDGEANLLYRLSSNLATVETYIKLEGFLAVTDEASTQGVNLIVNGIAYYVGYNREFQYVMGNRIADGKLITIAKLPFLINGYRVSHEPQAVIYDFDNDDFMISASAGIVGTYNHRYGYIFKIGLYKNIVAFNYANTIAYYGNFSSGDVAVVCYNGSTDLRPLQKVTGAHAYHFKTLADAINAQRYGNYINSMQISMADDSPVTSLGTLDLVGFKGFINSYSLGYGFVVGKVLCNNSDVRIKSIAFSSSEYEIGGTTYKSNFLAQGNSKVVFQNCTFENFGYTDQTPAHIIAIDTSEVLLDPSNNTFEGSIPEFIRLNFARIAWRGTKNVNSTYDTTANTYVYTGLSITVPDYVNAILQANVNAAYEIDGMIISKSNTSLAQANIVHEITKGDFGVPIIPLVKLNGGATYYFWVKSPTSDTGKGIYSQYIIKSDI